MSQGGGGLAQCPKPTLPEVTLKNWKPYNKPVLSVNPGPGPARRQTSESWRKLLSALPACSDGVGTSGPT